MASSRDVVVETDRLLAAAEASCRERFRPDDPDSSEARGSFRRAALRVTLRVAAASAFALAGVAAVSVGANGALAALGGGHTTPRTLPSTAPRGRWGSAFDAGAALTGGAVPVPEAPRHAAHDASRPAYRLRDGKAGAWTSARDVPNPTLTRRRRRESVSASATRGTTASEPLRAAPVLDLDPTAKVPKWDREPYEYEMPEVGRRANAEDVEDAGLASPRGLGSPARHPAVPTPKRRGGADFVAARLGDPEPAEPTSERLGEYEGDGSVPWDQMSPPPAPWAPYGPPLDRADAATLSRSRLRPAAWGATRDSSNDGALSDGEKESIVDWNALAADGAEANLPDAERETRSVVPDFDAFLAESEARFGANDVAEPMAFRGTDYEEGSPAAPTPVTFEEESYEAAMTDGDRFAAKTSYHAWNEEDPVEVADARRRREAAETERLRAIIHGDRARAEALANLGEAAMENSYEGDGSVPWDLSLPPMPPAEEEAEEDRGAMGATFGMTLDEYEAELEAHRASTPKARAEREAKETARRERSRRNADGSISWNAPPAPSAPPRRASGIANNDAVRAASTEDASVSWDDPTYDPRPKRVESEPEPERTFEYEPSLTKASKASDDAAELAGEKPRVNPDGSVPWDAYDPEDAWKPSDEDRAAYEDALERADETDEDAPVEEEEEEEEETSYTIGEGEGGAVAWNAAPEEETVSASAEENSVPAKLAMNTRDYDGVEAVDDGFIRDPEEAAEYEARLFTAALGDSLVEPDFAAGAEAERVVAPCMLSALGGSSGNEPLCQKYEGDAKACQTRYFKEQSCWHKTVGARFVDPESTTESGPRKGRGPPTRRDDPDRNAAWIKEYYDCMSGGEKYAGSVEAPYRLPQPTSARQVKKHFSAKKNEAYMYVFLHVPKAGGTYFKSLLHESAQSRIARLGGQDPRWDPEIVHNWNTGPLVDMTENAFASVKWHIVHQHPPQQFGGEGMRRSYDAGHRAVGKGALSLGVCEYVDAPCAYFTVLRDPFERYMSHYSYLCLEGSEDYTAWDPSWKRSKYAATGCPESPVQFFHRVGSSTTILAPGADPTTSCAVEAAKRNLRSGCMRYLLLDKLSHGLQMMRDRLPDFHDMGLADPAKTAVHKNGSGDRLTRRLQARLDSYLADEKEMAELKRLLKHETDVYEYAREHYYDQWDGDLLTC